MVKMVIKRKLNILTGNVWSRFANTKVVRRTLRSDLLQFLRKRWIVSIYLLLILSFSGGVMNTILEGSQGASTAAQTVPGTVANIFVLILGTAGVYLIYLSGRHTMGKGISNAYFLAGLMMLILIVFLGYTI